MTQLEIGYKATRKQFETAISRQSSIPGSREFLLAVAVIGQAYQDLIVTNHKKKKIDGKVVSFFFGEGLKLWAEIADIDHLVVLEFLRKGVIGLDAHYD